MDITIYHNPRCSKSRQTLALIEEAGYEPTIVKYLEDRLSASDLQTLMTRLGIGDPKEIMRKGETLYKELGLKDETDPATLLSAMVENPKLIERPIVVRGKQAIIGRPPENVNSLL